MTRVLSALVLLPIVVGTVWYLPPWGTLALALVAAALAFAEFATLAAALGANVPRAVSGVAVLAACAALGSGRIPLVAEPDAIFSLPLWSPDGQWLIFSRFDPVGEPQQSLWAVRRDGSELHQVAADGFQAAWVP